MDRSAAFDVSVPHCVPVLLLGTLLLSGCNDTPPMMKGLVPATGRVTLDRHPFPGVMVVFDHPEHVEVYGLTDQDGFFEMEYTTSQKGAFAGHNRVYFASSGTGRRTSERVPEEYLRRSSTLTVEVTGDHPTYNFNLESGLEEPELGGFRKQF